MSVGGASRSGGNTSAGRSTGSSNASRSGSSTSAGRGLGSSRAADRASKQGLSGSGAAGHSGRSGFGSSRPATSKASGPAGHSGKSSFTPGRTTSSAPGGSLRQGASGPGVSRLQDSLKKAGFNPGATDGKYGPKTAAAVRDFQRANGLSADGIAGRDTFSRLSGGGGVSRAPATSANPTLGTRNKTASLGKMGRNFSTTGGTITINGNTYRFNSGGSANRDRRWASSPSLPPGQYRISGNMPLKAHQQRTMTVGGVGYKYGMSDKFDPRVGQPRTALRIHPDGGRPGTQGCIGIVGDRNVQQRFQRDMDAELRRNGGSFTLQVR
ncbi:MAG: peptidoglycan-binding protein [Myxococcaceae bacterium]|jgi:peptidoglycan hydrolase-like protein with peptidoglycan-binding domain|nr:peptidoglycan-binding protein [Myxococcaceae bacterium]